jgi:hypothetical protein
MQQNLIPANKDPKILIKEKDKYFWHVEQTRRDVKPGNDPTNVRITTWVKAYTTKMYKRIFEGENTNRRGQPSVKGGMNLLPAGGIREARLVHDPVLQRQLEAEVKESDFAQRMAAAKAAKKADDDLGQGTEAPPDTGDDTGTARRPKRNKQ